MVNAILNINPVLLNALRKTQIPRNRIYVTEAIAESIRIVTRHLFSIVFHLTFARVPYFATFASVGGRGGGYDYGASLGRCVLLAN